MLQIPEAQAQQKAPIEQKNADDQQLLADLAAAAQLIAQGNYPQAELHVRRYQRLGGINAQADQLLAQIAQGYGLPHAFRLLENQSPVDASRKKYLLIRAWGYGFWSEVHHVLGQALVAELTDRIPIVWWGENCLFQDHHFPNAFEAFFQPMSAAQLPMHLETLSIYPPKWNRDNLNGEAINLWEGVHSRIAAHYCLGRTEDIVVSDFFTTVSSIIPWIDDRSVYYGLSNDQIYARLYQKYLKPSPLISGKADLFYQAHMADRRWIAVHVRGSDKIFESPGLYEINQQYFPLIDQITEVNPGMGIFLLTDSTAIFAQYTRRYGNRVIATSALRTDSDVGVHMQGHSGYILGEQVLLDVLLAIRCDFLVGNQESNVSLAIFSMKPWAANTVFLLGQQNARGENWFLHWRRNGLTNDDDSVSDHSQDAESKYQDSTETKSRLIGFFNRSYSRIKARIKRLQNH